MRLVITIALLIGFFSGHSQNCFLTLGEFYNALKTLDTKAIEKLNYRKYSSFNFGSFQPVEGKINQRDYYEIGYDKNNKIKQIIHYDTTGPTTMDVYYYFNKYKIMTLRYEKDGYMPVAFLMMDYHRLMITLQQVTGIEHFQYGTLYSNFPLGSLEDISSIMVLDVDMRTERCVIAHQGNVQISYEFDYIPKTDEINYELVRVFLNTKDRNGHKLDEKFCLSDLWHFFQLADFQFNTEPQNYKKGLPLWMYGGTEWHK